MKAGLYKKVKKELDERIAKLDKKIEDGEIDKETLLEFHSLSVFRAWLKDRKNRKETASPVDG
jgi:hypothetical protein